MKNGYPIITWEISLETELLIIYFSYQTNRLKPMQQEKIFLLGKILLLMNDFSFSNDETTDFLSLKIEQELSKIK